MKKILTLLSLAFLLSCQKGSDSTGDPQTDCKLTKVQYIMQQSPREYTATYSGDNITELVSSVDKVVFTYDGSGNLTKKEWFAIGSSEVIWRIQYTYNGQGQLTGQASYENSNGTLEQVNRYEFTYTNGKISELKTYSMPSDTYNGKNVLAWSNDNPATLSVYNENNDLECVTNFTYDLTKENKFNAKNTKFSQQDLYDDDFSNVLFLSKNVLTKISSQCPTLEEEIFTYTYDAKGNINEIFLAGEPQALWKFNYQCD